MSKSLRLILIVIAQFTATSVWFAGNAVYPDIQNTYGIDLDITPLLTTAVQFGFIIGTFSYAIGMIPDRFSPAKVFLISALLAGLLNLLILIQQPVWSIFISRLMVGFFLAGIYPVGMKIAADWFKSSLGNALGFLVGALVLGTSFPHFIKANSIGFPWELVIISTTVLSFIGGIIIYLFVGDGPDRSVGKAFDPKVLRILFKDKKFKGAAFGYFGHMWELYTFWAFTPALILLYNQQTDAHLPVSLVSFGIIAIGAVGCFLGGIISQKSGSQKVASVSLLASCICCLLAIISLFYFPSIFIAVLFIWGFTVIPDSPQFSSLVAKSAPADYIGSALTIVNFLGFAITIISIQLLAHLKFLAGFEFLFLAIGPIFGLYFLNANQRIDLQ